MACPTEQTVARFGLKTPDDFNRDTFHQVVVQAHTQNNVNVAEAGTHLPTSSGKPELA